MIAHPDTLSVIAQYLDNTDPLVYTSAPVFRLPYDTLNRMGLVTNFMSMTLLDTFPEMIFKVPFDKVKKVVASFPNPSLIADTILSRTAKEANFIPAIKGLIMNANLAENDDRLLSARVINAMHSSNAIDDADLVILYDEMIMRRLCRYDEVLMMYANFIWGPLDDIMSYSHGRSIVEMYKLIMSNNDNIGGLLRACTTMAETDELLRAISLSGFELNPLVIHYFMRETR